MSQPEVGSEKNRGSLPDFLIIGVQKGGTTTLCKNLQRHPGVYIASIKDNSSGEMHFFDNETKWSRGVDWYRSHFSHPELLQGEKTPNYLVRFASHERMHITVPDARLIIMLRNPVERAYSAWNHSNQQVELFSQWGWEVMAFEQALQRGVREREGIFADLITYGLYIRQIRHLLQFYPREQLHIMITERLRQAPEEEYRKVLAFLGLSPAGGGLKNYHVRRYRQSMAPTTRSRLKQLFQPYNEQLFAFLGERISEWE